MQLSVAVVLLLSYLWISCAQAEGQVVTKCLYDHFTTCDCKSCPTVKGSPYPNCRYITCSQGEFTSDTIKPALSSLRNVAPGLSTLRITHSILPELPSEMFGPSGPNKKLLYLHLAGNKISYIRNDSFTHMDNIIQLQLDSNEWDINETDVFQSFTNLRQLSMRQSIRWPQETAEEKPKYADAKYEKLFHLLDHLSLQRVKKLYLDGNMLKVGLLDFVERLPSLQKLSLSDNHMAFVRFPTLNSSHPLENLVLSNNNFSALAKPATDALDKLETDHRVTLDLSGNIFSCDCKKSSREFVLWLNNTAVDVVDKDTLTCLDYNGTIRKIIGFPQTEMKCYNPYLPSSQSHSQAAIVVLGLLVAAIICVLLVAGYRYKRGLRRLGEMLLPQSFRSGDNRRMGYSNVPSV